MTVSKGLREVRLAVWGMATPCDRGGYDAIPLIIIPRRRGRHQVAKAG